MAEYEKKVRDELTKHVRSAKAAEISAASA
jgi:hypothetical protein